MALRGGIVACLLSAGAVPCGAQRPPVSVQVLDAGSDVPLAGATVVVGQGVERPALLTDDEGRTPVVVVNGGPLVIRASRLGYAPLDTVVEFRADGGRITLRLIPRPLDIASLTATARRAEGGGARERALFDRAPTPGLVGVSRQELRDIPMLGEADPVRALQAMAGVEPVHDLSARLHVMGGGPDQNAFILDGARIFGPYHMFGIFGTFNPDAIGRAEMYRGSLPARHGGAVSSVVELEQRAGPPTGMIAEAGVGMLGLRGLVGGGMPTLAGNWMIAGRRTHADLVLDRYSARGFPYAFWDLHGQGTVRPSSNHRIRASFFGSGDRFRMFLERASDRMTSRWHNAAGSAQWDWTLPGVRSGLRGLVWGSRYDATLEVGGGLERPRSDNDVVAGGVELTLTHQGEAAGWRVGLDVERLHTELRGGEVVGGLFEGESRTHVTTAAAFADADVWLGPVRLGPGVRVERIGTEGPVVAPRLYARFHLTPDVALVAGASRGYQGVATLRDDRYPLPGPPFWFARGQGTPLLRADAVTAGIHGWVGPEWSVLANAYARRFDGVARWRPDGERTLATVTFDHGTAAGADVSVRRHGGRLTGWLGLGLARARLEGDEGSGYRPAWDRARSLDGAAFLDLGRGVTVSGRARYGSGTPTWPQSGSYRMGRLDPVTGNFNFNSVQPTWSSQQLRLPDYVRFDASVRWSFSAFGAHVTPHLSVLNLTGRQNVLYYRHALAAGPESDATLIPELQLPIPTAFPSLAVDITF